MPTSEGLVIAQLVGTFVLSQMTIVALLLSGKLRTDSDWKRLADESDRKDDLIERQSAQLQSVQDVFMDKAIPALERCSHALEDVSSLLRTEVTIRRPHDGQ